MREMRQMLGVLTEQSERATGHSQPAGPAGVPSIADIEDLVNELRSGGVQVGYEASGPWHRCSSAVQLCAYRVVQEATTNAVKHSPGQPISIRVASGADLLEVCVANAGTTSDTSDGGGMGLTGLRARVDAEGGRFRAGPTEGGWQVEAMLPIIAEVGR